MKVGITQLIPQNIAPAGAKSIGVYDGNGQKVAVIPLGRLTPPTEPPLYSFGLVSDVHLDKDAFYASWKSAAKLENALAYFEAQGCAFCVQCGDLTNQGFFHKNSAGEVWQDESEFVKYDEIRKNCDIPIYGICGNHESYGRDITDTTPVTIDGESKTMLEWLYDFTVETDGTTETAKLSYTVEHGNDLLIFVGQPKNVVPVCGPDGEENTDWLAGVFAANKDKRCFLFIHTYIEEDSGDPMDKRENSIFDTYWGATKTTAFKELLKQYPNVVLFHGHSHMKFECQELDKKANYTEVNGFKSVHVPSLSRPRNLDMDSTTSPTPYADSESQGYIVDVYPDCIILNGRDFVGGQWVSMGVLKIDT